jgi:hypothetical protein
MAFNVRECQEHQVYETLLKRVPNLEEQLMNASEEEVAMIADLASIHQLLSLTMLMMSSATKGGIKCQIRRYQEPQECHHRLDHPMWTISVPSTCTQYQDWS